MKLISPVPVIPAVTVADLKRAVHVDGVDDDTLLASYISAAQEVVEIAAWRPLRARLLQFEFDLNTDCDFTKWWFPVAPVANIVQVETWSVATGNTIIGLSEFALSGAYDEPKMHMSHVAVSAMVAMDSVQVQADVGYAANDVPETLKQAIILIVKEWFDQGVGIGALKETNLSFAAKNLIKQNKYTRPQEFG